MPVLVPMPMLVPVPVLVLMLMLVPVPVHVLVPYLDKFLLPICLMFSMWAGIAPKSTICKRMYHGNDASPTSFFGGSCLCSCPCLCIER